MSVTTKKPKMGVKKTPISYYGGKQNMLKHILPIIPKHEIYVEAFFGGGAQIRTCNGWLQLMVKGVKQKH